MSDENENLPVSPEGGDGAGTFGNPSISIEEEMKTSYLDYAMSVIVSRAIPDVRDGLKPVHRRILFAMHEAGYDWNKAYRKSARVVGDVIGKYHPHGDQAVYDALTRMAQDFSMRLPLLDGQGNFGSMDGDKPAAMRYTEIRMDRPAHALLEDIEKNTVTFQENYDGSESEPTVLPAKFPNILVNGAGGIAVGMATNIPPHNLGEVIDGCFAYLANPDITIEELMQHIPAPDFPTGGLILGQSGARSGFHTGRGSVVVRAKTHIEEIRKDREAIIVTEIPYQVNKANMIEKIAEMVRDKKVEGIADLRDESDREGVRVVIEIKRDHQADVVLNQLYRFSQLQTSFGMNMLALNNGRPEVMNLKDMIAAFTRYREEVITKRTKYDLSKARDRAHVLVGLAIAVANIDEIIALIRKAPDPATARAQLLERDWPAADIGPLIDLIADPRHTIQDGGIYKLSGEQAKAILDLRLQRLTALGRDEIDDELKKIGAEITDYLDILRSRERLEGIMRSEWTEMKEMFATPRRSEIVEAGLDMDDEDLIQQEDMVVTVTHGGYIKRVPLSTYRAQRRGGKGRSGMSTKDEDFVSQVFVANTHTPMLFFSSDGMVYKQKVWRMPLATPQARGKAMVNLLPLSDGEVINTVMPLPEDEETWADLNIMFATATGYVRRNKLSDFTNVMANGKIAMKLDDGDRIVAVRICTEDDDVMLTNRNGRSIRFAINDVRVFAGRNSIGVRGIKMQDDDRVVAMSILHHVDIDTEEARSYLKLANQMRRAIEGESGSDADIDDGATTAISQERYAELSAREQFILTITENGFGKRTSSYEYRTMGRGAQGNWAMEMSPRNGKIATSFPVEETDQIMCITDSGQLIRMPINDVRIAGRKTQGVTLFRTNDDEHVVSVAHLTDTGDEEVEDDMDGTEPSGQD